MASGHLFADVLALRLLLSLMALGALVTSAWLSQRPPVIIAAIALNGVGLFLYSIQGAAAAVLSGFERIDLVSRATIAGQLTFVSLGALSMWRGGGYLGLIIANLVGVALMAVMCWRSVEHLGAGVRSVAIRRWWPLLRASLPFGVIALALGLSYKFDVVLLSLFRGDVETGHYTAAYGLVFSAVAISNVLNTALYPSLARQALSSPHILPAIYGRAIRYLLIIALPIAVGVSVLADQLVPLLLGSDYLSAVPILRLVIWAVPMMYASEFLGYIVVIDGHERRVARAILGSTACNVLLNLLVVPRFGSLGAAGITVFTEVVLLAQYLWLLRALLARLVWRDSLLRPLIAVSAMGCLAAALGETSVPLAVGAAALTYGFLLVALGALGRDELSILRETWRGGATPASSG